MTTPQRSADGNFRRSTLGVRGYSAATVINRVPSAFYQANAIFIEPVGLVSDSAKWLDAQNQAWTTIDATAFAATATSTIDAEQVAEFFPDGPGYPSGQYQSIIFRSAVKFLVSDMTGMPLSYSLVFQPTSLANPVRAAKDGTEYQASYAGGVNLLIVDVRGDALWSDLNSDSIIKTVNLATLHDLFAAAGGGSITLSASELQPLIDASPDGFIYLGFIIDVDRAKTTLSPFSPPSTTLGFDYPTNAVSGLKPTLRAES